MAEKLILEALIPREDFDVEEKNENSLGQSKTTLSITDLEYDSFFFSAIRKPDFKRTNFMKMIQDSMEGKIDMILTKSISRFARNTLDTLKYVRMLKEKNVAILFEEENINTASGQHLWQIKCLSYIKENGKLEH